ncbi:unnamed protein product [Sphenostylis stenocarpa]|uniref:Uncharacterized protein n=1 Tax=Sphenostylis stenocarpa TaxID=92480 RepID=A0AA86VSK1_9FABA|nr:unnamed protein product [Sphenostylis stenocarpa]
MAYRWRNISGMMEADLAAQNNGTSDSFNNHGSGHQNFSNSKINSGAYAGDRNWYDSSQHYGGNTLNNSGIFNGNGNGGSIQGGFNSTTSNFYA